MVDPSKRLTCEQVRGAVALAGAAASPEAAGLTADTAQACPVRRPRGPCPLPLARVAPCAKVWAPLAPGAQVMAHPWIKAGEQPHEKRANLLATTSKMRNSMRMRSPVVERPPAELLEEVPEVGCLSLALGLGVNKVWLAMCLACLSFVLAERSPAELLAAFHGGDVLISFAFTFVVLRIWKGIKAAAEWERGWPS